MHLNKFIKVFAEVLISTCLGAYYFIVPVHADNYQYPVPDYAVSAFLFWYSKGFSNFIDIDDTKQSINITGSETGTIDAAGFESTSRILECRTTSNGTTTTCYVIDSNTHTAYGYTANQADSSTYSTYNLQGQIISSDRGEYFQPWLVVENKVIGHGAYNNNSRIYISKNQTYYISFYCSGNPGGADRISLYPYVSTSVLSKSQITSITSNGCFFKTYAIKNTGDSTWVTVDFDALTNTTTTKVIPVYNGYGTDLTDDMLQHIGLETKEIQAIHDLKNTLHTDNSSIIGIFNNYFPQFYNQLSNIFNSLNSNNKSKQIEGSIDNSSQILDSQNTELSNAESDINNQFYEADNSIDTNFRISNINAFTTSANWVATQYQRLVVGTPFEYILTFTLIFGIAMIMIGKVH